MREDPLQRQLRFSEALNQLAELSLQSDEPSVVLEAMVRIAGTALQVDRALVYDIRFAEETAVGLAEWLSDQPPLPAATLGTYPLSVFGEAPRELATRRGWLESSKQTPHPTLGRGAVALLHGEMGIESLLWFPFLFRENGYHLLAFNQLQPRAWREEELNFIDAAGRQASLALVKLQLLAQRQGALRRLEESEARYRALYDDTPSMFFTVSEAQQVTSVNRFAVEHLGYAEAELVGHDVLEVFVPEDREIIRRQLRECFEHPGRLFRWEARKRRKDGSVLSVREIARTGIGEGGKAQALIVCDDVTEQKRTEQAMLQAQKLETLGVLVGGISHDFNNLLGIIVGNAELALLRLPAASPAREPMQLAARAGLRAAELVRQLLAYSAKAPFARERVEVNELVRELADLLAVTVGKRSRVELKLNVGVPPVLTDPTQLRQVLVNLVHNAADAMEGREGAVRVETAATFLPAQNGANLPPGSYVRIDVTDTGVGIHPAALERIFDPFFTTKVTGRGLGLSAVRGIALRHGGGVLVESTPGRGSTFSVLFPVAPPMEIAPPPLADLGEELPLGATVLVIDDDLCVVGVLAAILEQFGLVPLVASGGRAAREVFLSHPETRCVLVDLTMPDGGGGPLVRALRQLRPATPIILMSGFAESEMKRELEGELAGFLAKPFTPDQLRAALVRALGATS